MAIFDASMFQFWDFEVFDSKIKNLQKAHSPLWQPFWRTASKIQSRLAVTKISEISWKSLISDFTTQSIILKTAKIRENSQIFTISAL